MSWASHRPTHSDRIVSDCRMANDAGMIAAAISAQICDMEATKIASDFEQECSLVGFRKETTTVDIYVYMQGQRRGPYEKVQLEAMSKRGQIPADTLYWHDGMSKW